MSKSNSKSKYIFEKENYSKATLSDRPPLHPVAAKENTLIFQYNDRSCQNHRERPSVFKIQTEGVPFYYCERCAILLASQGFSVEKIAHQQHQVQASVTQTLGSRKQYLKKQISRVSEYYSKVSANLNLYFGAIIQSINQKKSEFQLFIMKQEQLCLCEYKSELRRIQTLLSQYRQQKNLQTKVVQSVIKEMKLLSFQCKSEKESPIITKDVVTIDVNSIIEIINSNLKIKVYSEGGQAQSIRKEGEGDRSLYLDSEYSVDEYGV